MNVGYQKKGIDPLNSEKVILAVSDVLYGRKRQKPAKLGEKCFFLNSFHDRHVGHHERGNVALISHIAYWHCLLFQLLMLI